MSEPTNQEDGRYKQWLDSIFHHQDNEWHWEEDQGPFPLGFSQDTEASFFSRLLWNLNEELAGYSTVQIGQALWYLFGVASELVLHIVQIGPEESKLEWRKALHHAYLVEFPKLCKREGADCPESALPISCAIYMFGDMSSGILDDADHPPESTECARIAFQTIEDVIYKTKCVSCHESVMHALFELRLGLKPLAPHLKNLLLRVVENDSIPQSTRLQATSILDGSHP